MVNPLISSSSGTSPDMTGVVRFASCRQSVSDGSCRSSSQSDVWRKVTILDVYRFARRFTSDFDNPVGLCDAAGMVTPLTVRSDVSSLLRA